MRLTKRKETLQQAMRCSRLPSVLPHAVGDGVQEGLGAELRPGAGGWRQPEGRRNLGVRLRAKTSSVRICFVAGGAQWCPVVPSGAHWCSVVPSDAQ